MSAHALTWAAVLHLASMPACTVPGMVPAFWPAVVHQESGYDPLALHDDTAGRSYYPDSAEAAEAIATRLMAAGHSVGVGLSQLTARSEQQFRQKFGLTIREALDACTNMHAGARHYVADALSVYQSGNPETGIANGYVSRVTTAVTATREPSAATPSTECPVSDPTGWHVVSLPPGCQHADWHITPRSKETAQ